MIEKTHVRGRDDTTDTKALRAAAEGARRDGMWTALASDIEEAEEHVGWAVLTVEARNALDAALAASRGTT